MARWIEYTGSDEQINELKTAKNGYMVKGDFAPGDPITGSVVKKYNILIGCILDVCATHYLICEPHPYADIIKIWAETGCEVYMRFSYEYVDFIYKELAADKVKRLNEDMVEVKTEAPNWNIPGAEYRLTPFEEEIS